MAKDPNVKKVLVIGSGPIVIGQAAEFDYAGTQACLALKEEGIEVVLINSNPATIMTDTNIANHIYIEPLTIKTIKKIIKKEKPDSILPTLGGQTALNLAIELAEEGFLVDNKVKLLGTSMETIKNAEDRELFKATMEAIGQPVIDSIIATNIDSALDFAEKTGFPLIIRPAYTLGGTGGGIANNLDEFISIVKDGLRLSRVSQVLIERSVAGWKEIEFEVIRDKNDNCIVICEMENFDPVGIHTGDSIVVTPSQTLNKKEYDMLYNASKNIIRSLGVVGGSNVQYALDPNSLNYHVIEVNPRVSRSSALASKATGFPIAEISALLSIGYTLDEIKQNKLDKGLDKYSNDMDCVVVKIPKWPFDKFIEGDNTLGTKMKATGEIMAIANTFEEALMKAVRSLDKNMDGLGVFLKEYESLNKKLIIDKLDHKTDSRLFVIAEAIRQDISLDLIHEKTAINHYFLTTIKNIIELQKRIKDTDFNNLSENILLEAKKSGLSDRVIAKLSLVEESSVYKLRKKLNISPAFIEIGAAIDKKNNKSSYFYSSYNANSNSVTSNRKKVLVIGSGPIRIGQGIEFDYCSVHCVWALKEEGYETIIVNNNPETVSTDFNISDKLYFEPLTPEDLRSILEFENPQGVMVQFGGQTAINLADTVEDLGFDIFGTSLKSIDKAENREEFDGLMEELDIPRPIGTTVFTIDEALEAAQNIGYPVLIRPSYVLGGQGMEIAYNDKNVIEYMDIININPQEHPILIDKYIVGKEIEVDAISDGKDILIPGIMEHIERAGVHSGDSISVYPPQNLTENTIEKVIKYTKKISRKLKIKGLLNIQFVEYNDTVYIIEANPRSSRTIPYLSKVTGVPMIDMAVKASLNQSIKSMGYGVDLYKESNFIAVKVPVFSFDKLPLVDTGLGPEMKSTGEVLGLGRDLAEALYKGLLGAGFNLDKKGNVLLTIADIDKQEIIPIASRFKKLGFKIYATSGTALVLHSNYIAANVLRPIGGDSPNIENYIEEGKISIVINTPTKGKEQYRDGFKIRRLAVENSIPTLTSLDTTKALLATLEKNLDEDSMVIYSMEEIINEIN